MIRFSRSEDYAIILINILAKNYKIRFVPLSEIAKEYNISILFLRNLANELRKAGIIHAIEGKSGGYSLVNNPKKLKVGKVLRVFSAKPLLECCSYGKHKGSCDKVNFCEAGFIWRKLNKVFLSKIENMTIEEFRHYRT